MRRTAIIYGTIAACLCICWLTFLLLPQRKALDTLKEDRIEISSRLDKSRAGLRSLPLLLGEANSAESKRTKSVWSVDDLPELFDHLRDRAADYGLAVTDITPSLEQLVSLKQGSSDDEETGLLDMKLSLRGNYSDFGRFAQSLNEAEFVVRINGCKIASNPGDWKKISYTYDFRVRLLKTEGTA